MSDCLLLNSDGSPISVLPLSIVSWKDALRLVFAEKVKVIKEYDNWVVRSQKLQVNVPSIIMTTVYVKYTKMVKYSPLNVFIRDNFTCQLQITNKCTSVNGKVHHRDLTIDHVVPRAKGGKTAWHNVCTSCKLCNSKKGSNPEIKPKAIPVKPGYFEMLSKRKNMPLYVKDPGWASYLGWAPDLIRSEQLIPDYYTQDRFIFRDLIST